MMYCILVHCTRTSSFGCHSLMNSIFNAGFTVVYHPIQNLACTVDIVLLSRTDKVMSGYFTVQMRFVLFIC